MEQVALIKLSLLLTIQIQTSQLFTEIIKMESIYKSCYNANLEGLGSET
jgi:hypothetical protein